MNTRTKHDLIKFVAEITSLAPLLYNTIGHDAAKSLVESGSNLMTSLEHDETITETT